MRLFLFASVFFHVDTWAWHVWGVQKTKTMCSSGIGCQVLRCRARTGRCFVPGEALLIPPRTRHPVQHQLFRLDGARLTAHCPELTSKENLQLSANHEAGPVMTPTVAASHDAAVVTACSGSWLRTELCEAGQERRKVSQDYCQQKSGISVFVSRGQPGDLS